MSFSSGATARKSRPSKSARPRSEANFTPLFSMRSRKALPVRKVILWPSARSICTIASSGLIWPVAGVEAKSIFIVIGPLITDQAHLWVSRGGGHSAKSRPTAKPSDAQHGEGGPLRKNFRDRILRYVCNGAADEQVVLGSSHSTNRRSLDVGSVSDVAPTACCSRLKPETP